MTVQGKSKRMGHLRLLDVLICIYSCISTDYLILTKIMHSVCLISPPSVARLYFNTGGADGLDTGNTIPYFPPGTPVFTGSDFMRVGVAQGYAKQTKQENLR